MSSSIVERARVAALAINQLVDLDSQPFIHELHPSVAELIIQGRS